MRTQNKRRCVVQDSALKGEELNFWMNVNTDMSLNGQHNKIRPFEAEESQDKKTNIKTILVKNPAMATKNPKLINDIVRISVLEEELEYYKTLLPS